MRAFALPGPFPKPIRSAGPVSFVTRQKKPGKENRAAQAPRGFPPAMTFRWTHRDRIHLRVQRAVPGSVACAVRGRVPNLAYGYSLPGLAAPRNGAPAKARTVDPRWFGALQAPVAHTDDVACA